MNSFIFRGPEAELRWGYHQAAALGPWELNGATLTAEVKSADTFRTSQPSLTFRVPRPAGPAWTWPVESLQIADGHLSARLGPPQE